MLIIPFIENAFKHGVAKSIEKSWIKISLKETDWALNILVANSKTQSKVEDKTGGIGLMNVKKRLSLLYKEKYELNIFEEQMQYTVSLSIPIN